MADFSGLNSTLNNPIGSETVLLNLNMNNKQLKLRKNLNPVNVSNKIMKMLQDHENECNEQLKIQLQEELKQQQLNELAQIEENPNKTVTNFNFFY